MPLIRRAALLLVLATALAAAPTAAAEQRSLQLLSDATSFSVFFVGASEDGSHVFLDTSRPLLPSDTDQAIDAYERSAAGGLTAVSDGSVGPDEDVSAHLGAMSSDGTRLYLNALDSLLPGDTNLNRDLYLSTVAPDPPPGGEQKDATPPRLTGVKFARGRLRFTLSEPANVRIVIRRARARRARTLPLANRTAGPHRVRLRVRAGRYRTTITATDAAGNPLAAASPSLQGSVTRRTRSSESSGDPRPSRLLVRT